MAKRDTVAAILEAAANLFARFGFKRTPVDEIAKSARVSKATLYSYFPSKEALFSRIIERESDAILRDIEVAVAAATGARAKMRALLRAQFDTLERRIEAWSINPTAMYELITMAYERSHGNIERGLKLHTDIIREGVETGDFCCRDPDAAARAIQFLCHSKDMLRITLATDAEEFKKSYDALAELVLAGLRFDPTSKTGADR